MSQDTTTQIRLGLIGCGGRGSYLGCTVSQIDPRVRLTHIADPDVDAARTRLENAYAPVNLDGTTFHATHEALLARADELDGLIIATRCHLHTPLAAAAAATGLPIFLEKPVGIDRAQLATLWSALQHQSDRIVVSFPLRMTPVFVRVMEIIRTGRLGRINQVQAYNDVNYGGVYFGDHYRNFPETRGLWLQKATHDFDYLNVLLEHTEPRTIAAMSTRAIYGGDEPHDLRCSACDRQRTCPESAYHMALRGDGGGMSTEDHLCPFSRDIQNQDAGTATIRYADGTHVAYSQNFVARRSAGRRGARIVGYLGTLDFDFSGKIRVVEHHRDIVEDMMVTATGGHGGGDDVLLRNVVELIDTGVASCAPLRAGVLSATMSLAAHASCDTDTFQPIAIPQ